MTVGFEDESIEEEINNNKPDECQLFELEDDGYWSTFPGIDNQSNKALFLFNKIKACWQDPETFNSPFTINNDFFDITEEDVKNSKKILEEQCPVLYKGMATDQTILKALAIGHKNNMDYLQYLMDDYFKYRAQNIEQDKIYKVADWVKNHPHFLILKNMTLKNELQINDKAIKIEELVHSACNLYGKRFLPQLQYQSILKINDSLEVIMRYIEAAVTFIANLFGVTSENKTKRGICPFQFDLCITSGVSTEITSNDEDDDDNEEDDDYEEKITEPKEEQSANNDIDYIGDIEKRLKSNDINFEHTRLHVNSGGIEQQRVFTQLLEQYKQNNKCEEEKEKFAYPHKKRIIAFIDRRVSKNYTSDQDEEKCKDDIYLYPPPNNCCIIPNDAKSEWYLNSSKTCLLPNSLYGTKDKESQGIANNDEDDNKMTPENDMNIGTASNIKGSVLTISFHVMSQNEVKCYLYYNGQFSRIPMNNKDSIIKNMLESLFIMTNNDNQNYIGSEHIGEVIKVMNTHINDHKFDAFQKHVCSVTV